MKDEKLLPIEAFGSLKGKTVVLRIDVNSAVDPKTKKISSNVRIQAHAKTLALLSSKGARTIVLAHQGRKGLPDFIPLAQHAKLLAKLSGKPVQHYPDPQVISPKTIQKAKELKDGQIMLLDNVRFLDEEVENITPEEQAHRPLVHTIAPFSHLYVDDAFSNAHRAHESMTGFPQVLASAAGPVMLSELQGAKQALEPAKRPCVYVLGGAKPEEMIGIMKYALSHSIVDKILTCGVIGELCVIARGSSLSAAKMKWLNEKGYTQSLLALREVIHYYHEFIETPFDFALKDPQTGKRKEVFLTVLNKEEAATGDIGKKTATKFSKIVTKAKTVYVKGPCGMYEDPEFAAGTQAVFSAVAANQAAYTLIAGGNTADAFEKLKIPTSSISHISIGGGVLLDLMAGVTLPAVAALSHSAENFGTKLGYHEPKPFVRPEVTLALKEAAAKELKVKARKEKAALARIEKQKILAQKTKPKAKNKPKIKAKKKKR